MRKYFKIKSNGMSFGEYDRNLLQEFRNTLYEIRDLLAENLELAKTALSHSVRTHNKNAMLTQRQLRFQLDMLEDANEEE